MTHSMFVSLFPNWTGQTQPRVLEIGGDGLRLSTEAPTRSGGKAVMSYPEWQRASHLVGDEGQRKSTETLSAPGGLRAGFAHYRAFPEDARQVAEWAKAKLKTPVLALGGEWSLGEITRNLYGAVAEDVRGGVIPQCGHWVAEERPDYLVDQLLAFFHGGYEAEHA